MILPTRDAEHFFEIMMPLLEWIKSTKTGRAALKEARDNEPQYKDFEGAALSKILREHPDYIDKYLNKKGDTLSPETRRILSEWRAGLVDGPFIIERYLTIGAVFISVTDGRVYLVSGITSNIEESIPKDNLPCMVQTALLPYMGRIVYDSTMIALPESISGDAAKLLKDIFMTARRQGRLIKTLPTDVPPPEERVWHDLLSAVVPVVMKHTTDSISSEDVSKELASDPDLHLISGKKLARLEKLIKKLRRSQKEWDVIMDILNESDVFTASPAWKTEHLWDVDHVLCRDNDLLAFTTFEKCQDFIQTVAGKDGAPTLFNIVPMPYDAIVEIADEHQLLLYLDKEDEPLKRFLCYDSKTEMLRNCMVLPGGDKE